MTSLPRSEHRHGVFAQSTSGPHSRRLDWAGQPTVARVYILAVVLLGAACVVLLAPRTVPQPGLFAFTLLAACLTSAWKVNLPLPAVNESTLSVSFAADMMALMLLGPASAMVIAVIGAWVQCTVNVKERQPVYRTVFSAAAEAVSMTATGLIYHAAGGTLVGAQLVPVVSLVKPAAAAFVTCFCTNTGLVAAAIALSTGQDPFALWRGEFLLSGVSFMVSGATGAAAALLIARGEYRPAVLFLAPLYLVYWTYGAFVRRLAARAPEDAAAVDLKSSVGASESPAQNGDADTAGSPQIYRFGPFQLDVKKRRLWKSGQIVPLTPKAMDTLLVLVERAGQVVDRDDLLQTIWPDTFVSEETLTQNIATIRRALGDSFEAPKYVATVPRRGYQFIGVVTPAPKARASGEPPHMPSGSSRATR